MTSNEEKNETSEEWSEATTDLSVCDDGVCVEALLIIQSEQSLELTIEWWSVHGIGMVVESAEGLPSMDVMTQRADPYCLIKFGTRVLRTTIKRRTRKPKWNEEFRILVSSTELNYDLIIELWDWDLISNNIIGKTSLCIAPLLSLDSSPLHPFALPIQRAEPLIKRVTVSFYLFKIEKYCQSSMWILISDGIQYQKDGGILYLNAALVPRAEAEQLFWDKFLDLGPLFEGLKSPPTSPHKKRKNRKSYSEQDNDTIPPENFIPDPLLIWQVYLSIKRGDSLVELIEKNQGHCLSQHKEDKQLKREILVRITFFQISKHK